MLEVEVILARHEERLKNLEWCIRSYQAAMLRVEDKVDRIYKWTIALLGGVILNFLSNVL